MKKFLFCIIGETYRSGGQMSRKRDKNKKVIDLQIKSINSHIEFINYQKNTNNLHCDVILNLYSLDKQLDSDILQYYQNCNIIKYYFHQKLMGETNLIDNSIDVIKNNIHNDYEFILFTRADIFLKPYFSNIFYKNHNKIKFSFMNEYLDHNNKRQCGQIINNIHINPSICHVITYNPKRFFTLLFETKFIKKNHDAFKFLIKYFNNQYSQNISLFVNTYHSSSTNLEWNPIFYQVGRKYNTKWNNKNRIIKLDTLESIQTDTSLFYR